MIKDKKLLYLASPFFNAEQVDRIERVEEVLFSQDDYKTFSPRKEIVLHPDSSEEDRDHAFNENIKNLDNCDLVVCITDGKDIGTIWEAGYAFGKGKKILYFCETLNGNPFNVMLAKSAYGIATSIEQLKNMFETGELHNYYEGKIQ